VCPKC
jgi:very-short-patch-repair endonuclease